MSTVPSMADAIQAKKDMTDIGVFISSTDDQFTDNTGKSRLTLQGLTEQALAAVGYVVVGNFSTGCTITAANQVVSDNVSLWRWGGALPKVVNAGSSPTPSSPTAWTAVSGGSSDSGFKTSLAAPDTSDVIAGFKAKQLRVVDGLKGLTPTAGVVMQVKGFYAGSNYGGGNYHYEATRSKTEHNGVTVIAPEAISAWNGTLTGIATLFSWSGTGNGCYVKVGSDVSGLNTGLLDQYDGKAQIDKMLDLAISEFGNQTNSVTYYLSAPVSYRSERNFEGKHYSFGGTVLTPTGDFPVMVPKSGVPAFTRFSMSNIQFNCDAHTSVYAITFNEMYLAEFENVWFRNSYKGVNISNSDSMSFRNVKWMETQKNTAVFLGDNARSIKFTDCNFETSEALKFTGGVVHLNGYGNTMTDAQFQGCQWERSGLLVESGSATVLSGKFADSYLRLLSRSNNCDISGRFYGTAPIHDFGYNNIIRSVTSQNMATDIHEWPYIQTKDPITNDTPTFGDENKEMLLLVSIANKKNADITNGGIELKQNSTVLQSVTGKLVKRNLNTTGLAAKQCYTHLFAVKNTTVMTSVTATGGASIMAVRGGENKLTNGTFADNTTTGWLGVNCSLSAASNTMIVTPTGSNWGAYQNIDGICKQGARYIAVAKFTQGASFVLGNPWDGSTGEQPLTDEGIDLYGDGDRVAMLSFRFYRGISNRLSIGRLGSSTPVTVKYVMLIECPEYVVPKAADVPLETASVQPIGNLGSQSVYIAGEIPCAGAAVGDYCVASFSNPLLGCAVTAEVSAANTLKVTFINNTAAAANLGTGTIRVRVYRKNVN